MSMDSFFTIGKSHKVCEDYAIFTPETFPIPLFGISDGCSSSVDTDIGSRILLKSLISTYPNDTKLYVEECSVFWEKATKAVSILGLPLGCLDATLNFGYVTTLNKVEGVEVVTIGDGFVVAQKHTGEFVIIDIEFSQNAPYYLSYEFDSDRKDQFMKLGQKIFCLIFNQGLHLKFLQFEIFTFQSHPSSLHTEQPAQPPKHTGWPTGTRSLTFLSFFAP